MKRVIRLTESDLNNIVKHTLTETLKEHGMGLIGAYQASQNNLKDRMVKGQRDKLVRPNGKIESNKDRIKNAKSRLKAMMKEEFIKTFGEEGANIDCVCYYHKNHAYDFTYHLKGIEQINTKTFSIIGDIIDIDDYALPVSLKNAIVPKTIDNVILVYNLSKRTISLTRPISGLTIYPYDNGNDSWKKLLTLVGKFIEGLIGVAR